MKKILFIGNSHTYFNDMPQMLSELYRMAGEDVHVTMLTQGGMTLDWHCQQEQTAFNLRYGGYDFCILQQAAHPFAGYAALSDGIQHIRALARENPPRFVLYMTWAEKAKPENQAEMSAAYRQTAAEQELLLAPVGDRWQRFRVVHPETELYFTDGAHASPAGSLLAACTIYTAIEEKKLPLIGPSESMVLDRMDAETREKVIRFCQEDTIKK
ncbi:MAG: hypothetical protein ACOX6P_05805 [Candidatus Merdivicinus sp.]|jgi:hypothetical protein